MCTPLRQSPTLVIEMPLRHWTACSTLAIPFGFGVSGGVIFEDWNIKFIHILFHFYLKILLLGFTYNAWIFLLFPNLIASKDALHLGLGVRVFLFPTGRCTCPFAFWFAYFSFHLWCISLQLVNICICRSRRITSGAKLRPPWTVWIRNIVSVKFRLIVPNFQKFLRWFELKITHGYNWSEKSIKVGNLGNEASQLVGLWLIRLVRVDFYYEFFISDRPNWTKPKKFGQVGFFGRPIKGSMGARILA